MDMIEDLKKQLDAYYSWLKDETALKVIDTLATKETSAPTKLLEDARHKKHVPSTSFSPPCDV